MIRLILIRHGKTVGQQGCYYGWHDIGLSELGKQQSGQVVEALNEEKIDAVFSSDLSRTRFLGELLAKKKNLSLTIDQRLREVHFGDWECQPSSELFKRADYQKWLADVAHEKIPGGESMALLMMRTTSFLEQLFENYDGKVIAVVGHYGSLKCLFLQTMQKTLADFWTFHIELASISIVNYDMENSRVILLNDLCHSGGLNAHFN